MKAHPLLSLVVLLSLVAVHVAPTSSAGAMPFALGSQADSAPLPLEVTALASPPSAPSASSMISPDWWAAVQEDIQSSEYDVTWQDAAPVLALAGRGMSPGAGAYHAPNRAQNLRAYFTSEGLYIVPRGEAGPSWGVGLFLFNYGAGAALLPVAEAVLFPEANRVEYRYEYEYGSREEGVAGSAGLRAAGVDLSIQYVNDREGLEQRISLDRCPVSLSPCPLVLGLAHEGNLIPALADDGHSVEFLTPDGRPVLRYRDLYAIDGAGRSLPVQLSLVFPAARPGSPIAESPRTILRLAVQAVVFPVSLTAMVSSPSADGLSIFPEWTAESDQADAFFGAAVATAGDVNGDGFSDIVVGAYGYDNGHAEEGRAFLYYGSPSGLSTVPGWAAEGDQNGAWFGRSVGVAGDVNGDGYADVVVAAPYYDSGQTDEGIVYVYHGSPAGLGASPEWIAEGGQDGAHFGSAVGPAGDVDGDGYADLVVGASEYDDGQTDEGAAFLYLGSVAGLGATPVWEVGGDQDGAHVGAAVSTAGDVNGDGYADVVVGASLYDNGYTDEGQVRLYFGSSAGLTLTVGWSASGGQSGAEFGSAVDTVGDVNGDGYADVIVGAERYDNGQADEGAAFLYLGSPEGPSGSADWTAEGGQDGARLGGAVGPAGDVNGDGYSDLVVSAHLYDNGQADEGAVFVYLGSAGGLPGDADWAAEGDQSGAQFGSAVDTAGDTNGDGYADVIVGAARYDNGQTDEGGAFAYHGSPAGLASAAAWAAEGDEEGSRLGTSVGTAGDVNGDGYTDVIVGAPGFDNGPLTLGRAYVYHGSASGLGQAPAWIAEGEQDDAQFAYSVGTAGDVDGDGYADVIVGAYQYDHGESDEGAALVYMGSPAGLSTTPAWMAEGDQVGAWFGWSVGTGGDVNGDGYADVIVGAYQYDLAETDEGAAFVYLGSSSGLAQTPAWLVGGGQAYAALGCSVATAGDVNGDGYSDVIVGARDYDGAGLVNRGRAFVYHGSAPGLSPVPDWFADGERTWIEFGNAVGTAGDVNGDGYADVIVGAWDYRFGWGAAYVYHGSTAGLTTTVSWAAAGSQEFDLFGESVGTAGDVNGDGFADVLVGASRYDNGERDEGMAYVYHGSVNGLSPTPVWTAEGNQINAWLGSAVSLAGDVNGDGCAEVIVGAEGYDNGQTDEGAAQLYLGNNGGGSPVLPRQMRTDGSAPIAPLGRSDAGTAVQLRLTGRSALGRDVVKLQWQIAPLGTPFTATGIISGTSVEWIDTLTAGVAITQNVDGLTGVTSYHWRVRVFHRPGNRLGLAAGRWVHMPWNSWTELDFRTPDEPIVGLEAFNDSPTALGSPTTLTATVAAGSQVSFSWALGDGEVASGAVLTHIYPAAGRYVALVTATNPISQLTTTTVVLIDEPIAGLEAFNNSPTALGSPTTLTATVSAGGNVDYAWAFGDGEVDYGAVVSHTYPATGTYAALVTATNSLGWLTATTLVQIVDVPIVGLEAFNDSPTRVGSPTTLTATVAAGTSVHYVWALGDGNLGSGAVVSHTYAAEGSYVALVTASNSLNWLTATTVVTVLPCVPVTGTAFAWTPLTPTVGEMVTFSGTAGGDPPLTFSWHFGDGGSAGGAQVTHSYAALGDYVVTLSVTNSCGAQSVTHTVRVVEGCNPPGNASFSWVPPEPVVGAVVTFTAMSAGTPPLTFTWAFGDGAHGEGATPVHTYALSATYTVVLSVSNRCGGPVVVVQPVRVVKPVGPSTWAIYVPLILKGY